MSEAVIKAARGMAASRNFGMFMHNLDTIKWGFKVSGNYNSASFKSFCNTHIAWGIWNRFWLDTCPGEVARLLYNLPMRVHESYADYIEKRLMYDVIEVLVNPPTTTKTLEDFM
jgi:hypothetical protein